ncbi:MAG TPA: sulfite exporter TauE/SafE family protein [Burkholderiaceae bacterium]|nr:sulfite exporter TauE/SafE family protein [Burkholderiaceae bacterium]
MDWYVLAAGCLVVGALIGFTGGVLGIGGGLLAIPLLGLLLGMEQQMAQGTALVMVLPAVLMTLRQYNRYSKLDIQAAVIGGMASMVFTWIGAQIALGLDPVLLRRIYAVFIFGISIFYFHQSTRKRRSRSAAAAPPSRHKGWFVLVGGLAGLTGGVFGVGGSVMVVPLLTTVLRYSQTGAQGLALSMIVPSTTVAILTYAWHGQVTWLAGLPLALGSIVMVPFGVKLAYALPEPRLKLIFACMLLVIMMLLLFKV